MIHAGFANPGFERMLGLRLARPFTKLLVRYPFAVHHGVVRCGGGIGQKYLHVARRRGGTAASHELTWDATILGCEKFYYASASVWVVQMSIQPTDRVMGVKTPLASI